MSLSDGAPTSTGPRVPKELWCMIWRNLSQQDRYAAAAVCASWRVVATHTPTLWTTVEISCSSLDHNPGCPIVGCDTPRQCSSLPTAEQILRWSTDLQLRICINARDAHAGVTQQLVATLRPHAARIADLRLACETIAELATLVQGLPPLTAATHISAAPLSHTPHPVVVDPDSTPALVALDVGNAYLHCHYPQGVPREGFASLRHVSSSFRNETNLELLLSLTPRLEVLTMRYLILSQFDAASFARRPSLRARLARLRELHLTFVTHAHERLFADHAYARMSVCFAPRKDTIGFLMLDGVPAPTHIVGCLVEIRNAWTAAAIVVRDERSGRERLFAFDKRFAPEAIATLWTKLPARTPLHLTLSSALWNAVDGGDWVARGVTALTLILDPATELGDVEVLSTTFPDLQHLAFKSLPGKPAHMPRTTLLALLDSQRAPLDSLSFGAVSCDVVAAELDKFANTVIWNAPAAEEDEFINSFAKSINWRTM